MIDTQQYTAKMVFIQAIYFFQCNKTGWFCIRRLKLSCERSFEELGLPKDETQFYKKKARSGNRPGFAKFELELT